MAYVLLADENPTQREGLRASLEAQGRETIQAANADEAKKAIDLGDVSLVIANAESPIIDAYALLAWAKARVPALPFLLLGQFESEDTAIKAYACGADDLLSQPRFASDPWPLLRWLTNHGQLATQPSRPSVDSEFVRLGIDSVPTQAPLRLDVYVRLSAAKYVRVARQGAAFDPLRTDRYRGRGVRSLFLRRTDLPKDPPMDTRETA